MEEKKNKSKGVVNLQKRYAPSVVGAKLDASAKPTVFIEERGKGLLTPRPDVSSNWREEGKSVGCEVAQTG